MTPQPDLAAIIANIRALHQPIPEGSGGTGDTPATSWNGPCRADGSAWPCDAEYAARALLAATPSVEPAGPYTERAEHERQANAGAHSFDEQCPFCFFDHFTPEARTECASWPPTMPSVEPASIQPRGYHLATPATPKRRRSR